MSLEPRSGLNLYCHFYHSACQVRGCPLLQDARDRRRDYREKTRDLREGLGVVEVRSDSQELLDFIHHGSGVSSKLMAVYDHQLHGKTFIL